MMESLLKSRPSASETIGFASGRWDKGSTFQRCAWCSWRVAFSSLAVGLRAASLTSSRRVGMLEGERIC